MEIPRITVIITTGILAILLLLGLGFLGLLLWVIVGVLCSIVIGVFSWLINLTSKSREVRKSPRSGSTGKETVSKKWIANKEIVLKVDNHETFPVELEKGEHLLGEILSEEAINVYLVNRYGLSRFESGEDFSYEDCGGGEGIRRTGIDFAPLKFGRWFLVVDNEANEDTNVEIRLYVTDNR